MQKLSIQNLIKLFNKENNYFYITLVNKYNYQVKQYKIDKDNKKIIEGTFSYNENITTRTALKDFISFLKLFEYKEI